MAEKPLLKEPSPLLDKAEKAFEKHKKMRRFFECVENGSKEDLKEIEEIFATDDSRLTIIFFHLYIMRG